jgi:hypothetical protein
MSGRRKLTFGRGAGLTGGEVVTGESLMGKSDAASVAQAQSDDKDELGSSATHGRILALWKYRVRP